MTWTIRRPSPRGQTHTSTFLRYLVLLMCLKAGALAYTLQQRTMAREIPSGCDTPATVTTFPLSAQRVYVWFYVTGVATTDAFHYEWVSPQGSVRASGVWSREQGTRCYWAWITKDYLGQVTGNWAVRVSANGTSLFTLSFRIATVNEACPIQELSPTSSYIGQLLGSDCLSTDVLSYGSETYARRYLVRVPTVGVLRLDLLSSAFDSYLYLLRSDGVMLDSDDDGGDGTNARIVLPIEPGDYLIVATSYHSGSTGSFQLRSTFQNPGNCGVSNLLPNESLTSALNSGDCPLTVFLPDNNSGSLARQFRLVVSRPGFLTIDLESEFDTYLYLMTSRYRVIDENDDGGDGLNSRIRRRMEAGIYYIVATSYRSDTTGPFTLQTRFDSGSDTVSLFLHGLNSDADAWRAFNRNEMGGQCERITSATISRDEPIARTPCYLYDFDEKTVSGIRWGRGDGSTYAELGTEVGKAVDWIRLRHDIRTLVLVGHSRGGLAARAYLQSLPTRLPFRTGLVTIGTPHLGSPFGRTRWWLNAHKREPRDEDCELVHSSWLKFIFSPSTGHLATSHGSDQRPQRSLVSEAIWALNDGAPMLRNVDLFGELRSKLMTFGENVSGFPFYLDASTLAKCLTNSDSEQTELLNYIKSNLPDSWLSEGDGIVAFESQQLLNVPGAPRGMTVWYIDLKQRTSHVDETSRTSSIKAILDKVSSELDSAADPFGVAPLSSTNSIETPSEEQSRMEEDQRFRMQEAIGSLRLRHGDSFAREFSRAEDLAIRGDFPRLFELGAEILPERASPSDESTQIAVRLLTLSKTKKGVAKILATISRESGWDVESARRIGADLALAADESSLQVLRTVLYSADPHDLIADTAAEALLSARSGNGVRLFLEYVATLTEPSAIRVTADRLARTGSTRSTAALRKLLPTMKFVSEDARLAVEHIAADLEGNLQVKSTHRP